MTTEGQGGYIFTPALQDISLKRFRLRYCSYHDCYYLHWDNAVCPPLARIEGYANGLYSVSGIQRRMNKEGEVYLSTVEDSDNPSMQWQMDFSTSGLVVHRLEVKVRCGGEENMGGVSFTIRGDDNVYLSPLLGDQPVEIPQVRGCKSITLTCSLHPEFVMGSLKVLDTSHDTTHDCPLDIIVELMCPRGDEFDIPFVGELLLGVKFAPEDANSSSDVELANGDNPRMGQLQVHVVEGAGLVDQDTFKPFNAYVKCDLLPDIGKHSSKQTSPKHNAYPTWAKEFFFTDLSYQDLVYGGLEVALYNHHHLLHDSMIGGVRLCVPLKKPTPETSPVESRSYSPVGADENGEICPSPNELSPTRCMFDQLDINVRFRSNSGSTPPRGRQNKSKSLPLSHSMNTFESMANNGSPILRRARSPSPQGYTSNNTLSPVVRRRDRRSLSPSPRTAAKNFFRLSGSHLKEAFSFSFTPNSSPRGSPISSRRRIRHSNSSRNGSIDSEFVFKWMEDCSEGGDNHWQQVLDKAGQWVYFWHILQPKLKPVC